MARLTHLDERGGAHMVDVGDKTDNDRLAVAEGHVTMSPEALAIVAEERASKGNVLTTAQIAGIMAAKRTSELIPLCHPLMLSKVAVELETDADLPGVRVRATVRTRGQTGVEMEALSAVSVACLTVYDMVKAVDRSMTISAIRLILKDGGKSGRYEAK